MPPELQRLADEILSLPVPSRTVLFQCILESLSRSESEAIERTWAKIAEERCRQIDAGEVELLDGDEVLRELRARPR
ncbi:addiction module protein [Polyangium mundeleinium]|uniref:Addiction module protein n=1 Tax=Polyangium mundeleinium TaxID=2995306 RepID=A0ABT5ESH7_9BACT|nr:addiction module protein [Polyangium mundeleinium]MDC0744307.1 addiction module protein [Polyangium mundeleinium]